MIKLTHVLGHNSNWNIDVFNQQELGDFFLYTAYSIGRDFESKPRYQQVFANAMVDLQFYGKKESIDVKGRLGEFDFHPVHSNNGELTNVYFMNCIKQSIIYQERLGFKNIIIPHYYEENNVEDISRTIKEINSYLRENKKNNINYFMTLPFSNELIKDDEKVEELLLLCTSFEIVFDGYFIVCENKPAFKQKVTIDYDLISNLSKCLKTLKEQEFKTIYAYANFDALIYLTKANIDYVTIGTYENLRNFDINRFTQERSGGPSDGYYFSEKLLNLVRAANITILRHRNFLDLIRNDNNIFSDIILERGYNWNIHKPDVNKNYLLSVGQLLKKVSNISDIDRRKEFVLELIDRAIDIYDTLQENNIFLNDESGNYHLSVWKTFILDDQ